MVAEQLGVSDGETVRLVTEHGDAGSGPGDRRHLPGNLSMPHGYGLLWENEETGELEPRRQRAGAGQRAASGSPDGVPYHKYIPARVEKVKSG